MIPAPGPSRRRTACLSTQVGCDVGCRFCASGIGGSQRNLTAGEIMEQALAIDAMLRQQQERLSHVVFMGMGEPLANYEATVEAIRRLNANWGLGLAQRRITVSTVGLPKQIERLADENLQITLALEPSCPHRWAAERSSFPGRGASPSTDSWTACRTYRRQTGREITLEYCLLAEVNDHRSHATRAGHHRPRPRRAHQSAGVQPCARIYPSPAPVATRAIAFLKQLRQLGARTHT